MSVFSPTRSFTLSASATSASVSFDSEPSIIRVYNEGPNSAFVCWGTVSQTALLTHMILPASTLEAFDKGAANNLAAICSTSATAILRITLGIGE